MQKVISAGGWRFVKYFFYSIPIIIFISFPAIFQYGILTGISLFIIGIIIAFYFFFTSAFTYHTLSKKGITIRFGWFWRAHIPAHNIKRISPLENIYTPYSFYYDSEREVFYALTSSYNGIFIQLRDPMRFKASLNRRIRGIVFSVSDMEEFKKWAMKYYTSFSDTVICPLCGRREIIEKRKKRKSVVRKKQTKIEHIFLVYNDGRLITLYNERGDVETSRVVSGMFTIIQDFISDAFRTGGVTKRIEHEGMTILVEYSPHLYLFVVFRGDVEEKKYRKEMKAILNELEDTYRDELIDWDGNITHISGAKRIISQVLWI